MEAYTVVNDSSDEVFHFDLYEWYIEKNWTDRILAIDSPHVITYLQRLAETDYQHAELLCRFYTHRSRFFEAAQVQATLAKSDLNIGLKDRITLLSRAKGNASVNTIGVSRQQQQLLNHEVTELLEIAHIQDDLLERLKADPRISQDKLPDIEQALDGPVKGVTEVRSILSPLTPPFLTNPLRLRSSTTNTPTRQPISTSASSSTTQPTTTTPASSSTPGSA